MLRETFVAMTYILFVTSVDSTPCSRLESINITTGEHFGNNSILYDGILYTTDLWYEVEEEGYIARFGCPCIGRTCVWKCCNSGQAYFDRECNDTDLDIVNPFNPPVYKGKEALATVQASLQFYYMYSRLCDDRYLVDSSLTTEEVYIQENGTLYEISQGRQQWHLPTVYCVDMLVDNTTINPRLVAVVCYPDVTDVDSSALYAAYAIGLLLSVPFLLATFLVYAFIPEMRNVHGMCLMAYCWGLIVAYVFLAYLKLRSGDVGLTISGCLVMAFIVYYSFQTSFFWLNVMCFDIWRTFSGYRGGSKNKRQERKRFALYGLYAWGVPMVLTAITAGMQFGDVPGDIITPGFGSRRCWFENWLSELVYFFIPVLVLVVCNIGLFTITAHRIRSIRQETAILKGSESARSDKLKRDKQRYGLYLKLFVVMGVNWSVELISFAVGGSNWYWILTDISNVMLGCFIFMIFVWKNKVRNLIAKRWRSARGIPTAKESGTGRWATQSSSAPTEDTRISTDDTLMRMKDMR